MSSKKTNHLAQEKSPYLQQHAHNPVDWYPWGEEAFAAARNQDKPIFLSIGYSTCHWCHVMERESFENESVASVMNADYINIKVDREERPDVDALYMTAVQALTGRGGWPMSVWLTPDLKPFYGGTYFPPEDRHGLPGFVTVLKFLADKWKNDREKVFNSARDITRSLEEVVTTGFKNPTPRSDTKDIADQAFRQLSTSFDSAHGGFGKAPKFPMPTYLDFLLKHYFISKEPTALSMVRDTLNGMLGGGIFDQLGGGFSRYSTDAAWVIPHFEKMLYDNGQLVRIMADYFQLDPDPRIEIALRSTIEYLMRDLRHSGGAFFSAEDADSEGTEGKFYVWTLAEIKNALPPDTAEILIQYYGVTVNGNFQDPHSSDVGRNILVARKKIEDVAASLNLSVESTREMIQSGSQVLFKIREGRIRPHRDEKILSGWNGLIIGGMARAGLILNKPEWVEAAEGAAQFIYDHMYDSASGLLFRRWRDEERKFEGQQLDYALLIHGLLDLFEASGKVAWLEWAKDLQKRHDSDFWDPASGGYFMNTARPDLLFQVKEDGDNVIPSGNSIAVINGFKLFYLLGEEAFRDKAIKTVDAFGRALGTFPAGLTTMVTGLFWESEGGRKVILSGDPNSKEFKGLRQASTQSPDPFLIQIPLYGKENLAKLSKLTPYIQNMDPNPGTAQAIFCQKFACQAPTTDPVELSRQLANTMKL